jgi:hypothetical protein
MDPLKDSPEIIQAQARIKEIWATGKIRIILSLIGVLVVIFLWNDYRDTKAALQQQVAKTSTLETKFQVIGDSVVGQGKILEDQNRALLAATANQGQIVAQMRAQGNQMQAMFEAQGRIIAELVRNQGTTTPVTPGQDGSFKEARMLQGRTSGPALTEVLLSYNPKATDPTKRLLGDWTNYREDFKPSVVEWKKKDGGYFGTFNLRRTVFRPDGSKVGEENIPISDATASFSPSTLPGGAPDVPRWTITLGPARSLTFSNDPNQPSKWMPAALLDYRMTTHLGITGGIVGNYMVGGFSYRFGGPN